MQLQPLVLLAMIPNESLREFLLANKNKSAVEAVKNLPASAKMFLTAKFNLYNARELIAELLNFWEEEGYCFKDSEIRVFQQENMTIGQLLLSFAKPIDKLVIVKESDDEAKIDMKTEILAHVFEVVSRISIGS